MIIIRFPDDSTECKGLGFLAKRFSLTTWADGRTLVPEEALTPLALAGIAFSVEGPASHDQLEATVRSPLTSAV